MTTLCRDAAAVEFRFFRPDVSEVLLAGDFAGDWAQRLPMAREAYGWWTLRLELAPGEYRFRYVADGEWYTDFAAHGVEFDEHGWNSVLVVPDRPSLPRPARESHHDENDALLVA